MLCPPQRALLASEDLDPVVDIALLVLAIPTGTVPLSVFALLAWALNLPLDAFPIPHMRSGGRQLDAAL